MFCRRRLKLEARIKRWITRRLKGKNKVKILMITAILITTVAPTCQAGEREQYDGLFSEGSFLSEAISSVTGKIDKVASGEEKIVDNNARGMGRDSFEYDEDSIRSKKGTKDRFDD